MRARLTAAPPPLSDDPAKAFALYQEAKNRADRTHRIADMGDAVRAWNRFLAIAITEPSDREDLQA